MELYVDENNFKHYTNDFSSEDSSKKSIPYRLEHVFDMCTDSYVLNKDNCCYFSPVFDVENTVVVSSDESIVNVVDGFIVAENQGTCKLSITSKGYDFTTKPLLISVYKGNLPVTRKRSVFLKRDTVVEVGNFLRHCHCTHLEDCLFQKRIFDLDYDELSDEIWLVDNCIRDYQKIIDEYVNGSIIYHKSLDELYDIRLEHTDGGVVTCVGVVDGFYDKVKGEIKRLGVLSRDLHRTRLRLK